MEEDALQPRARLAEEKPLETYSVDELRAYEARLLRELENVRAMIEQKQNHLSGAQSLFRL